MFLLKSEWSICIFNYGSYFDGCLGFVFVLSGLEGSTTTFLMFRLISKRSDIYKSYLHQSNPRTTSRRERYICCNPQHPEDNNQINIPPRGRSFYNPHYGSIRIDLSPPEPWSTSLSSPPRWILASYPSAPIYISINSEVHVIATANTFDSGYRTWFLCSYSSTWTYLVWDSSWYANRGAYQL